METLANLESFVRAAEGGSFSEAGRRMGLTAAAVSRNVAMLERNLGVRLFQRSTRKLTLTDAGERFLVSIDSSLDALQGAIAEAAAHNSEPAGVFRVQHESIGWPLVAPEYEWRRDGGNAHRKYRRERSRRDARGGTSWNSRRSLRSSGRIRIRGFIVKHCGRPRKKILVVRQIVASVVRRITCECTNGVQRRPPTQCDNFAPICVEISHGDGGSKISGSGPIACYPCLADVLYIGCFLWAPNLCTPFAKYRH